MCPFADSPKEKLLSSQTTGRQPLLQFEFLSWGDCAGNCAECQSSIRAAGAPALDRVARQLQKLTQMTCWECSALARPRSDLCWQPTDRRGAGEGKTEHKMRRLDCLHVWYSYVG